MSTAEKDLRERLAVWRAKNDKALAKAPLRKPKFETDAEIAVPDVSTAADVVIDDEELGLPGEFPFTRGVQSTMYRGRLWTMRQYAGFGNAEESNQRYHYLLKQGQTGLSVAFDLPTQMGRDPDHALARGEVGRVGVSIASIHDMRTLLKGLPLGEVSTSMTINSTASTLLALYVAVADEMGVPRAKLSGTIQNDILKEYVARGTYIYPPRPSMRVITDTFAWCKAEVPRWNTISISGYHIREAGSDAVQEVAFTLADGVAYVEAAIKAGLSVDDFGPRLAFFFNSHNVLVEEIAKFRAARRLWAKIMRDRFGAKDPKSWQLRFHAQTAGSSLQAQQTLVNVVRTTVQAMAAILGGAQSLHTNSFDEALALPTEDSARLALRTQQVLAYESGLGDWVDPFGGAYAVEQLTLEIERKAAEELRRIDEMGGMVAAIEKGHPQHAIAERAWAYQRAIEQKTKIIVGVNQFQIDEKPPEGLQKISPALEDRRRGEIAAVRKNRDEQRAQAALAALKTTAEGTDNLLPRILDVVRAEGTLGEISDTLRTVFGEHRQI